MDKVGRPRGLIAYDTMRNLDAGAEDAETVQDLLRPRVILYAAAIALVGLIMLVALVMRPDLEVNVLHDRNPLYVKLSDGGRAQRLRDQTVEQALPAARVQDSAWKDCLVPQLKLVGHEGGVVPVPPDNLKSMTLYVTLDKKAVIRLFPARQRHSTLS